MEIEFEGANKTAVAPSQHRVLLAYNACMMGKHAKGLLCLLISIVTLGFALLLVNSSMYAGGWMWSEAVS